MANRLESRVAKLERVSNVSQNGCIVYFENVERSTVVDLDGDEQEVFVGGNFTIDGRKMDIDEVNAYLTDKACQVVYLPARRVNVL